MLNLTVYLIAVVDLLPLFFFLSFCIIGINDQGLYRVVGVSSKVQRLLTLLMGMPLFYNIFFLYFMSCLFCCLYLMLQASVLVLYTRHIWFALLHENYTCRTVRSPLVEHRE